MKKGKTRWYTELPSGKNTRNSKQTLSLPHQRDSDGCVNRDSNPDSSAFKPQSLTIELTDTKLFYYRSENCNQLLRK